MWIELTDVGRFALCSEEVYLLNTAYFLLPPSNTNSKFLLGILNSSVIRFYLGLIAETSGMGTSRWINNYVKEFPIPTIAPAQRAVIETLVEYILFLKGQPENPPINKYVPNDHIAQLFEDVIDGCVYELYFEDALKAKNVDLIQFVRAQFKPIAGLTHPQEIRNVIEESYQILRDAKGEIRNRLMKQKIVVDEIRIINEALK